METPQRKPIHAADNKPSVTETVKTLVVKRRKFLIVAAAFCLLGATLLTRSHAASFVASIEAEAGQLSGNFGSGPTAGASGGASVTFGASTGGGNPTPTPTPPGGVGSDPTVATCPSPTPVAPITGYTIKACEDFTSGLGAFDAYEGGGESTVTGAGRKASQCTNGGGMLVLAQASDGATCGGSMGSFNGRYGYWEVKMKITDLGGSGSKPHPVLILWPDSDNWSDGELDYFETDIGEGVGGYLHCTGGNIAQNCYTLPDFDVDYSQWHVYGFEWTASGATGYIDGEKWYTTNDSSWQPAGSMHQTIQLDNLDGGTPVRPGKMEIDWVHMYSK